MKIHCMPSSLNINAVRINTLTFYPNHRTAVETFLYCAKKVNNTLRSTILTPIHRQVSIHLTQHISFQVSFYALLWRWDIWQWEETSHASAALGNVCLETVWPLQGSKQFTSSGRKSYQPLHAFVPFSLFSRLKLSTQIMKEYWFIIKL